VISSSPNEKGLSTNGLASSRNTRPSPSTRAPSGASNRPRKRAAAGKRRTRPSRCSPSVAGRRIVVAGGGEAAVAKLRLLLKTEALIEVHAEAPAPEVIEWAAAGRLTLVHRSLAAGDVAGAALFFAASDDNAEDARTAALARAEGVIVNAVDNLDASDFITPAIVDRDPVTVAIGTEGAAPVLARAVKAAVEERLPQSTGPLARAGQSFRPAAEVLPHGRPRRDLRHPRESRTVRELRRL
jgi:uroporphyrin-III C-methyltransferase/precorrin-2 dehydrogenase/sirohydrochlorin ferrochelatase